MIKKNLKTLVISSIIILLPMVAGLLLWDQLPEQLATHWNAAGQVDGWMSRGMAVFGIPVFLLAVQWLCVWVTGADKKNENQTKKALTMVLWITPVMSILCAAMIYGDALGMKINVTMLMPMVLGAMFVFLGNYLPKCKCNYTIGIKLPWTVSSEENWNATHRLGGRVWVAAGVLMMACAFLPGDWSVFLIFLIAAVAVAVPTVYSYVYYRKHHAK